MKKDPETGGKKWTIPGEVMARIIYDVGGEVPTEDSELLYNDEMLEFRAVVDKEWKTWLNEHPNAELHAPEDLPSANIPFDK